MTPWCSRAFTGLSHFADIAPYVTQSGSDTVINLASAGYALTITLEHFLGTLNDDNVWFA